MAEEVIYSLEKMKLTMDEEEVIAISEEGRKEEIDSCLQSLVGKFLTCKPFNRKAAQNTLRKAWGLGDGVQIVEVGANLFQFKFKSEFELERVVRGGPWSFDNQVLMLQRWQPGMTAANVKFESVALWIQIWGAPFDMVSPNVATEIGKRMGEVVDVEKRKGQDMQQLFMRVKVALPTSKPLRRGAFLGSSDGHNTWVQFKYERLPMFCHFCGIMGHDIKNCAQHYASRKNGREDVCQYGDWLKATGGRFRSPPKVSPTNITQPNNAAGNQGGLTGVGEKHTVPPPERKSHGSNDNVKQGNTESEENVCVTDGEIDEAIMGMENPLSSVSNPAGIISNSVHSLNRTSSGHVGSNSNKPHDGHVSVANHVGLLDSRQKPTWRRVIRMESGPRGDNREEVAHVLGKRCVRSQETINGDDNENMEKKKSKTQSEDQKSETAGVLEHPCRA